jgi:PAS domain S-box-containing protein
MSDADRKNAAQSRQPEHLVVERHRRVTVDNEQVAENDLAFRGLVDALSDAVFVVSRGRIVFANYFSIKLLGAQQADQIVGRDISDFIHPDFLASVRRKMEDCRRTAHGDLPTEQALLSLDGSSVRIELVSVPISWLGSPAVMFIVRDIREQERTKDRLREYEKAVEGLEESLAVVDREYRYVIANRAFLNSKGYKREEVLGRSVSEVLNAGVFEAIVKSKLDECFQGKVINYEMKYKYPVVGERDVLASYFPIEGASGVDRVACVLQDVTDRKRSEETLRECDETFHQIADNIQEIFWMVDAASKETIYVNSAFEKITGLPLATLLEAPLSYRELIHPDDRMRVLNQLEEAVKTGKFEEEFRIIYRDGTLRWLASRGFAVRDVEGHTFRLVGVAQDITERKLAEQSLQTARAELAHLQRVLGMGELVASIAHEVNQPLTGVVANGNFALREIISGTPKLEKVRQVIVEIMMDVARINAIISRIRSFLRKVTPDMTNLSMNDVIREVIVLVRSEAVGSEVDIRLDLAVDLPPVLGDKVLLQQVLINLIMNGIDAMRAVRELPRNLDIRSARHADGVLIQVQDSGIGLAADRVDRVFEPFFTTKDQGIGMGLSICRSIIESHQGRLWTEPSSCGALFQFILPIDKESVA